MSPFLEAHLKKLREWLASGPEVPAALVEARLYRLLQASERFLIEAYEYATGLRLDIPRDLTGGYIEFGVVLHWLHYPDPDWKEVTDTIVWALNVIEGSVLPNTTINLELYENIKQLAELRGIVAEDGTIWGLGTYEALDWHWITALFYFLYYQFLPFEIHPFGNTPRIVPVPSRAQTRIAIVGDWGTGKYGDKGGPALAVMNAIKSLDPQPDYLIHLGDVYYAGTQDWEVFSGEETTNFMDFWPADRYGGQPHENTSFTLNSNHEMYDGGNGYFSVALGDTKTPFALQRGTSYFALSIKPWLILGLDSAYFARASSLFMQGSLGPSDGNQMKWIETNFRHFKGKNVIVLTHHNGISYDGTTPEPIWDEVKQVLQGRPDYWYWGHIHNGIVYSPTLPTADGAKVRCIGHGAIPYGKAWGLAGASGIDYYGQTLESPKGVRVRNGFAILTLRSDGSLNEVFYEVEDGTNKPIPVWTG